jgi:hypothetical protein
MIRLLLAANTVAAATLSCNEWPQSCPGTVPAFGQTWQMNKSTIIMPCNTTGYTNPEYIKGWSTVDFDWSNGKGTGTSDGWAKHQPMDDEEMLFHQVKMTAAETPNARVWVYRNLQWAYPWYTDVRKILEDPDYSDWFLKFKDSGPTFSKRCDKSKPLVCR